MNDLTEHFSKKVCIRITKTVFKRRLITNIHEKKWDLVALTSFLSKVNRVYFLEKSKKFADCFYCTATWWINNQSNQMITLKEQTLSFPVIILVATQHNTQTLQLLIARHIRIYYSWQNNNDSVVFCMYYASGSCTLYQTLVTI